MPVPKIQLRTKLSDEAMAKRKGGPATFSDAAILLNEDCDVYKPNGEPLLMLRRGCLDSEICESAYPGLRHLRNVKSDNRGVYSGAGRKQILRKDGTLSKQSRAKGVSSSVIGFFDRQGGRFPFCRATAFTAKEVEHWKNVQPLIRQVSDLYEKTCSARFKKQKQAVSKCHPDWVIGGTPFSTVTVNNNVVAGIHRDKGDFKEGMGVITVLRRGHYRGSWLVFPQFSCGVDLGDRDMVLFNPHEWHATTPFEDGEEGFERISCVYYFRTKMLNCKNAAQELARAKARGSLEV